MLAYIDSFSGPLPCKVVGADRFMLRVMVTARRDRLGYKLGQIVELPHHYVVPQAALYRSRMACGQYRIRPYSWARILFTGSKF